jgi:hypothetical protein
MTPHQMITVVASVIIVVMATTESVFNSLAAIIEIPTYENNVSYNGS